MGNQLTTLLNYIFFIFFKLISLFDKEWHILLASQEYLLYYFFLLLKV